MSDSAKLVAIFEYALNQEKTGQVFFQSALKRLGAGAAVSAFKVLVEEEGRHIAFIEGILDSLHKNGKVRVATVGKGKDAGGDFFDERARKELLDQSIEGSMVADVTVFNTAWLIEKDISEFYARMAEESTDKDAKKAFAMLADWEKGHERMFRDFRDKLQATYASMPWGG